LVTGTEPPAEAEPPVETEKPTKTLPPTEKPKYRQKLLGKGPTRTSPGADFLFVQEPEMALKLRLEAKVHVPVVLLYRTVMSHISPEVGIEE
jgi:hypothetical protein